MLLTSAWESTSDQSCVLVTQAESDIGLQALGSLV